MVKKIKVGGCTPLGPAVGVAVGVVGGTMGGGGGGRVVVCTDGVANVGVGSLVGGWGGGKGYKDEEGFYERVGRVAGGRGVGVSVVGVEGEDCAMEFLGRSAEVWIISFSCICFVCSFFISLYLLVNLLFSPS